MSSHTKIKKGDQVQVMAGRDKGKRGKVLRVDRKAGRVVVEHVNMVKRHTKANPRAGQQGGIVEREGGIAIANVALVSPDSGRPSRVGYHVHEDGHKVRVAKVDKFTLDQ